MPLAWIAWMRQQKRGFWFARDPRDYWINPNLQNILHLYDLPRCESMPE